MTIVGDELAAFLHNRELHADRRRLSTWLQLQHFCWGLRVALLRARDETCLLIGALEVAGSGLDGHRRRAGRAG